MSVSSERAVGRIACECYGVPLRSGAGLRVHGVAESHRSACAEYRKLDEFMREERGLRELRLTGVLSPEEAMQIRALPPSLANWSGTLETLNLYGTNLVELPREVGQLRKLTTIVIHTSYCLHYLPYEVMHCPRLCHLSASPGAIYGEKGNKFPALRVPAAVRTLKDLSLAACLEFGLTIPESLRELRDMAKTMFPCSTCRQKWVGPNAALFWVTKMIGQQSMALLIHACSKECVRRHEPTAHL